MRLPHPAATPKTRAAGRTPDDDAPSRSLPGSAGGRGARRRDERSPPEGDSAQGVAHRAARTRAPRGAGPTAQSTRGGTGSAHPGRDAPRRRGPRGRPSPTGTSLSQDTPRAEATNIGQRIREGQRPHAAEAIVRENTEGLVDTAVGVAIHLPELLREPPLPPNAVVERRTVSFHPQAPLDASELSRIAPHRRGQLPGDGLQGRHEIHEQWR